MSNIGNTVNPDIYIGTWTNWSRGKILGSTLTLAQRDGSFLIAFLALFVSFTGTCCFRITCFILHHLLSSESSQDALYHQRQVLLRNSSSGTSALSSFFQLLWSRRHFRKQQQPLIRILPLLLHSAIIISAFATAGVFSSRIAALTGDEVLIKSPYNKPFAIINASEMDPIDLATLVYPDTSQQMNTFLNYAQDCYLSHNVTSGTCNTFIKRQLPRSIEKNASCPFSADICQSQWDNIKIDSGYIDSREDLGLNTPEKYRFKIRSILHCAPLKTNGYVAKTVSTEHNETQYFYDYMYGPVSGDVPGGQEKIYYNYTYTVRSRPLQHLSLTSTYSARYGLGVMFAYTFMGQILHQDDSVSWYPIESLQRNDSDIMLIYLSAQEIKYNQQVDDPWFSAKNPTVINVLQPSVGAPVVRNQMYTADQAGSPLGCVSQYQTCIKRSSNTICSKLGGIYEHKVDFRESLNVSIAEAAVLAFSFGKLPDMSAVYNQITFLGPEVLEAKYTLRRGEQSGIPKDQWQREVTRWSAIQLSALQHLHVRFATGEPDERLLAYHDPPYNTAELFFAQNQKIRSTAYANFSVLGLSITFSIGTLIIVIEIVLDCVYVRLLWKGRDYHQYERLEWCVNGTLQLQRLAHEQMGFGTWYDCDEEIPVEKEGATLATLDFSDPKHPILQRKLSASSNSQTSVQRTSKTSSTADQNAEEISAHPSGPTHEVSPVQDARPPPSIEVHISSRTPSPPPPG